MKYVLIIMIINFALNDGVSSSVATAEFQNEGLCMVAAKKAENLYRSFLWKRGKEPRDGYVVGTAKIKTICIPSEDDGMQTMELITK